MEKLRKIIQIVIGVLFILSGALKALDSQTFSVLIKSYGFWGGLGYLGPFISGIEILLGLFLILNIRARATALIVSLLTIVFTISFAYAFFAKGIEDCGCMGNFVTIPPAVSFARNIFIIAGGLWIWKYNSDEKTETDTWKRWTVLVVGCLSFLVAGYTLGKQIIDKNNIHQGDQLSTSLFRFFDRSVFTGKTVVYIFSPNCGHCWNSTENVKSIKEIPQFNNLVGVTFNDVDIADYVAAMQPNFEIVNYPTDELHDYVKEVPVLLILNNGKVEKMFKSQDIPCGKMLEKMLGENVSR
jgi:uncharacterized membrane protein YphA (DoxX/SURF4 family)